MTTAARRTRRLPGPIPAAGKGLLLPGWSWPPARGGRLRAARGLRRLRAALELARLRPRSVVQKMGIEPLRRARLRPLHPGIVLFIGHRGGPCGAADGPTGLVVDATRAGAPARPSRISSRHRSRRSARNKKGDRPVRTYPLYFDAAPLCCCRSWPYLASYSWYAMA